MYYIKIFGRMLELQNKKIGRKISRPETLRAAKMHVNKNFANLKDKTIYIASEFNSHKTPIKYKPV